MILRIVIIVLTLLSLPSLARAEEQRSVGVEINKGAMVKLSRPAASVVIANPDIADVQVVSPRLVMVRGKKIGETSFYAVDAQDDPIVNATVNVTHNLSNLQRAVRSAAPDADIGFKTVDGGLVLEGFAASPGESESIRDIAASFLGKDEKMVNMIKTAGSDQVMLKVKIVEMARTSLKKFGINVEQVTNQDAGDFGLQFVQGNEIFFYGPDPAVFYKRNFGSPLRRGSSTDTNLMFKWKDYASVINAMETEGLATVLAEPSLTTTSGKAASFLAGGQFPIPAAGQNGTITIQYQPFGVSLNFTPVVLNKDRISLTVAPEVSTLNFSNPIQVSGITYPIFNTRKASAVVELGSGDSFMLAGLIQNDSNNNIKKFPGLGDMPVLGALFRSTQFQNNETELVILVTPYVVRPVTNQKLQTPLDGYVPPTDLQILLYGSLYGQQPMTKETEKKISAMPKLSGEGGFILE